jgi:hypothetical protein
VLIVFLLLIMRNICPHTVPAMLVLFVREYVDLISQCSD